MAHSFNANWQVALVVMFKPQLVSISMDGMGVI
jgi:hypothetical protein